MGRTEGEKILDFTGGVILKIIREKSLISRL